jgi:hypothetical protein
MDDETLAEELNARAERLTAAGHPNKVIVAYQELGWLLAEREAVQAYAQTAGNMALPRQLPDLATVGETLALAQQEYQVKAEDLRRLQMLLQRLVMPSMRRREQRREKPIKSL